jgi:hypothetical protein
MSNPAYNAKVARREWRNETVSPAAELRTHDWIIDDWITADCGTTSAGSFPNADRIFLRWERPDRFEYVPDADKPLSFTRASNELITPGSFWRRLQHAPVKEVRDAEIVIFSAINSQTPEQEPAKLGHGALAFALTQGLSGSAAIEGERDRSARSDALRLARGEADYEWRLGAGDQSLRGEGFVIAWWMSASSAS